MPKVKSNLLELVESESDDGADILWGSRPTQAKPAEMSPAKKPRGRAAGTANKVTKPAQKSTARRASDKLAAAIDSPEGRAALAEKSSNRQPKALARGRKGAKVVEEDEELAPPVVAKPRGRPRKVVQEMVEEEEEEEEEELEAVKPAVKRGRKKAVPEKDETEIPETQQVEPDPEQSAMDLDLDEADEVEDLPMHDSTVASIEERRPASRVRPSATTRPAPSSTSFDDNDPSLRRRLGELTKKHEALEARYRNLRDVAVREAERNFDRLKKQSEERASAANELIANLKASVAAHKESAKDAQKLQAKLETSESRVDALQSKVTELTNSVAGSKTEIKSLTVKLAASRTAEAAAAAAAKVPGSALKNGAGLRNNNDAILQATQMQMKEDLYSDLTGLIVRGVKKEGEDDVFDCLQTGRNGSEYRISYFVVDRRGVSAANL